MIRLRPGRKPVLPWPTESHENSPLTSPLEGEWTVRCRIPTGNGNRYSVSFPVVTRREIEASVCLRCRGCSISSPLLEKRMHGVPPLIPLRKRGPTPRAFVQGGGALRPTTNSGVSRIPTLPLPERRSQPVRAIYSVGSGKVMRAQTGCYHRALQIARVCGSLAISCMGVIGSPTGRRAR